MKLKEFAAYLLALLFGTCIALAVFYRSQVMQWFEPAYFTADYQRYYQMQTDHPNAKVILYGTAWCPYCGQTRSYFKNREVEFIDLDIEKQTQAKIQYDQLGGENIPIVLIGNRRINGFKPEQFDRALETLHSDTVKAP